MKNILVKKYSKKYLFYLKVNKDTHISFKCLQNWINVISHIDDSDFYIICDKKNIKSKILEYIHFHTKNKIKFLKSKYFGHQKIINNLTTSSWRKAGFAHLTTFYHAKKLGAKNFWNIDADDTMFLIDPPKAAEILIKAQDYAETNNLSAFSMDMHTSRTSGVHWSFGITYINSKINWFQEFALETNTQWMKKYSHICPHMNIDWYLTYLRDFKGFNNKIFYVDNMYFLHDGEVYADPYIWGINYWKNGKVFYPTVKYIYNYSNLAELPIHKDNIKIDTLENEEQSLNFMRNYLTPNFRWKK